LTLAGLQKLPELLPPPLKNKEGNIVMILVGQECATQILIGQRARSII
jgi:hypothetical protein